MVSHFQIVPDILIGEGVIKKIGEKVNKCAGESVLIVADPVMKQFNVVQSITDMLNDYAIVVDVCYEVESNPSIEVLEHAISTLQGKSYDVYIGLGGGSVLDIAKALALIETNQDCSCIFDQKNARFNKGKPTIMIPTTAGTGKEMMRSAVFIEDDQGVKRKIISDYLLPDFVLLDPTLIQLCSPMITAAAGADAFSHVLQAYLLQKSEGIITSFAMSSIKLISNYLVAATYNRQDMQAHAALAKGSMLAGIVCNHTEFNPMHALTTPLEVVLKIPHGIASAILLPYMLNECVTGRHDRMQELVTALKLTNNTTAQESRGALVQYVKNLFVGVGLPTTLADFGMTHFDVTPMAEAAYETVSQYKIGHKLMNIQMIEKIYYQALSGTFMVQV